MKQKKHVLGTLPILLSAVVFVVISLTMSILGASTFLLVRVGYIRALSPPDLPGMLLMNAVLSTVIGTVLTLLFSRIPLRPLRRVISAMRRVASGDFSLQLETRDSGGELNELYQSFNAMVRELQSVEILRQDFINNFSHEFKTPIVSIRGFAKMVKNPALSDAERGEYLDIIINESDRLAALATNVLDLSRLENQKIISDASVFCLSEQIRRCILILQPKWEKKLIEVSADLAEEVEYLGSEKLLSQVWMNLLDNAVKFAPEGGRINVGLGRSEGGVSCRIENTGSHISAEGLARIFEKFYQDDLSHSTAGNGLGLTIVSKVVSMHGGTAGAENTPDGAAFTVFLPDKGGPLP